MLSYIQVFDLLIACVDPRTPLPKKMTYLKGDLEYVKRGLLKRPTKEALPRSKMVLACVDLEFHEPSCSENMSKETLEYVIRDL